MKKMTAFIILISPLMTISAIAKCPFSYTVYVMDNDYTYGRPWDKVFFQDFWPPVHISTPIFSGYPAMLRVLDIEPFTEINPYNPYIEYKKDDHWDFSCYGKSYFTTSCHYFMISQAKENCAYTQATKFRVIIGTQATPKNPDGTLNLRDDRSGRNCILTVNAGQDTNLELDGLPNCTQNIQFDSFIENKIDPFKVDMETGTGEKTLNWFPGWNPKTWFRYATDSDYVFYPEFSTPKN